MTGGRTIRRRPTAAVPALAAALAVLVAAPTGGESTIAAAPHVRPRARAGAEAPGRTEAGCRLYALPETYRGPLGTFNQAALVAHQKRRLSVINEQLYVVLRMVETRHYLLFSDADAATTNRFRAWSEALYKSLLKQFGLPDRTRVWDGKCIVILFTRRRAFEAYSKRFDGHDARQAGAYFAAEVHGPGLPHLVHICFRLDTSDVRRQQELFAHEGTHAFFELYKTPGRLPLWLHEGLAEYMTTVNDRALRRAKWFPAVHVAATGRPIAPLFAATPADGLPVEQYSVAFTLVDFLLEAGRPAFKTFVDGLKDGKEQAAALQKAYGFDFAELERRWRGHVRRKPTGQ